MAWNEMLKALLGGTLVFAQPSIDSSSTTVKVDELLAYDCAKNISGLVNAGVNQPGPMFTEGSLVFTSLETQTHAVILLVNAGFGNYAVPLEGIGVNRIRFELPTTAKGVLRTYYLSYLHGGNLRSRYFEFGEERPPMGHDELDYATLTPNRAEGLLPHFDYAIHETAQLMLNNIADGLFDRKQLVAHRVQNCEYIARHDPVLARTLQRSIDQLDMIVMGPKPTTIGMSTGGRLPASMDKPRLVKF